MVPSQPFHALEGSRSDTSSIDWGGQYGQFIFYFNGRGVFVQCEVCFDSTWHADAFTDSAGYLFRSVGR